MSAAFTPAPWVLSDIRYRADGCERRNITSGEHLVAIAPARSWIASDEANARLIAAAPELYAALLEAREFAAQFNRGGEMFRRIDAALAKARGEQVSA